MNTNYEIKWFEPFKSLKLLFSVQKNNRAFLDLLKSEGPSRKFSVMYVFFLPDYVIVGF